MALHFLEEAPLAMGVAPEPHSLPLCFCVRACQDPVVYSTGGFETGFLSYPQWPQSPGLAAVDPAAVFLCGNVL